MNNGNEIMESQDIILSICIVTYNHENYIRECLDSILSQEMDFQFEIIIGNDCSTDNTAMVLRDYTDETIVINRTENLGLCANLYDLFLRARGKYILSFAGDDYFCDTQALKKQVDFLEKHMDYYSVSAWHYLLKDETETLHPCQRNNSIKELSLEGFLRSGEIPVTEGMMRNTFFEDRNSNGFLRHGAKNNDEMKLWFYILSKGKKYILQEYMHVYRFVIKKGTDNYNSTHTVLDMFKDYYGDLLMLKRLFGKDYNFNPAIMRKSNSFCIKLSSNMKDIMMFLKEMRAIDIIRLLIYKLYLKTHNYKDPSKWDKRNYLIKTRN